MKSAEVYLLTSLASDLVT